MFKTKSQLVLDFVEVTDPDKYYMYINEMRLFICILKQVSQFILIFHVGETKIFVLYSNVNVRWFHGMQIHADYLPFTGQLKFFKNCQTKFIQIIEYQWYFALCTLLSKSYELLKRPENRFLHIKHSSYLNDELNGTSQVCTSEMLL